MNIDDYAHFYHIAHLYGFTKIREKVKKLRFGIMNSPKFVYNVAFFLLKI
jgi:hypothetical protein